MDESSYLFGPANSEQEKTNSPKCSLEPLTESSVSPVNTSQNTNQQSDVDEALSFTIPTASTIQERDLELLSRIEDLTSIHLNQFHILGNHADLDKAIESEFQAVLLTPESHSDMPQRLNNLAYSLECRFQLLGELVDIDTAIECYDQAISLAPQSHASRTTWLGNLANSLKTRFWRLGILADLDKAVVHLSQAVHLTPEGHSDLPTRLENLGNLLCARFQQLGDTADIEKAIEYEGQAVSLTPRGHPDMPSRLQSLGVSLYERFQRLGELEDIEKAIAHTSQAVSLTPPGHPDMPIHLQCLGASLHKRFQRLGKLEDIEKAIENKSLAVSLTLPGHSDLPSRLHSLGVSLHGRFERLGELTDIKVAIEHKSQAVSLTPPDHPDMPSRLLSLGVSLHERFGRLGELAVADIKMAIEHKSQAVALTPLGHSETPRRLLSLAASLHKRFQELGDLEDLERAIEHENQAVSLTPLGHPDLPKRLEGLGASLGIRFQRLSELEDIERAIEHLRQAVSLTPSGHPEMPQRLDSLGVSLHERFQQLGQLADIKMAIEYKSQAVSLTPPGHADMARRLQSFGASLYERFQRLGELEDLEKAIEHSSKAVSLTPPDHSDLPRQLQNLGASLHQRFQQWGEFADIEKAIEHLRQAVSLTPPGHPDMPTRLCNLGEIYLCSSHIQTRAQSIEKSLDCFQKSAKCSAGAPIDKFNSAIRWATLCEAHCSPSLLEAYQQAMLLLPQVVWLGSTVDRRYETIANVGDITATAAAAAIKMKDYEQALEWVEEGRSIVWKQILQLRTPMDDLAAVSPKLALALKDIAYKLDLASSPRPIQRLTLTNTLSLEQAAQEHRRLALRWEKLLTEARGLPGFEYFLRPQKVTELVHAAVSSSVVVVNVHKSRIDALVIQQGYNEISHIPLALSYEQVSRTRFQLEHFVRRRAPANRYPVFEEPSPEDMLKEMLETLWIGAVKPVVDFLGYTQQTPSTENLPRITWCTTGPLSFLPLHAAGDYRSETRVFNYIVSSYTPTLSVLLSPPPAPITFSGLLAVGQKSTLGTPSLPGTDVELTRIQEMTQGHIVTRLDGELATPVAVLTGMEEHSWVHLACHAMQNPTRPMESAFYLHDGMLSLAAITQKQLKHVDLAFLSACQTATGDKNLSDEAVHLAAGMLMAGYRTVIATMWSIGDDDAPLIAETVYEHLLKNGSPDARKAAVAVHKATQRLREKVGMEDFMKWVPYIHIGL